MRFVTLIRVSTLLIAVFYALGSLPTEWLQWLHMWIENSAVIYETGYSTFLSAGEYGLYIAAAAAVVIAFAAVPRRDWGGAALSWCFLVMGICLLTQLQLAYANRFLGIVTQITGYARTVCFALPPLILGAVLQYPFVQRQLQADAGNDRKHV